LQARYAGYLSHTTYGVEVASGSTSFVHDIELRAGDINGDDAINLFDLVSVSSKYGATGSFLTEDLNADGVVDLFDLVLVSSSYGLSG